MAGKNHTAIRRVLLFVARLFWVSSFLLALAACSFPQSAPLVYEAVAGDSASAVRPQKTESGTYLFLPASADFSRILFRTDGGATISAVDDNSVPIGLDGSPVDLTALFGGEMLPGREYPVLITRNGQQERITLMRSENLPSLHLTLDTSLERIHTSRNKSVRASGTLELVNPDGSALAAALKQLKGRGNSTWLAQTDKKPYNIKLEKKAELIPGSGEAKNWCLLANNIAGETSGLGSAVAFRANQALGGASALSGQSVDLYIDEEYRGTYFLTEKVELHKERVALPESEYVTEDKEVVTRVIQNAPIQNGGEAWRNLNNISTAEKRQNKEMYRAVRIQYDDADPAITAGIQAYQYASGSELRTPGGFLLELNNRYYYEYAWFLTRRGVSFSLQEPEYATREQVRAIAIYTQEFEDALFSESGFNEKGKYYTDYVDMDSLIAQYLLDCFTLNGDMYCNSSFFYAGVEPDGAVKGPLIKGPAWDYNWPLLGDMTFFSGKIGKSLNNLDATANTRYAEQLLRRGDFAAELFQRSRGALREYWESLLSGGFDEAVREISASKAMDDVRWQADYQDALPEFGQGPFPDVAAVVRKHFADRYPYWYDTVLSDSNLLGVTASGNGDTLAAEVRGAAAAYQWYRADRDSAWDAAPLDGATGPEWIPDRPGVYFVSVEGNNPAYSEWYEGFTDVFTTDGVPSLPLRRTVRMYSNPVVWPEEDPAR